MSLEFTGGNRTPCCSTPGYCEIAFGAASRWWEIHSHVPPEVRLWHHPNRWARLITCRFPRRLRPNSQPADVHDALTMLLCSFRLDDLSLPWARPWCFAPGFVASMDT